MVFSSITFLFLFLPITLLVYYVVPIKAKNYWLLFASLVFYAFGEPWYLFLLLGSIAVNYGGGLLVEQWRETKRAKVVLVVALCLNLGSLAVFKYLDMLLDLVGRLSQALGGGSVPLVGLALPIGISFFTFQGISYVVDVYRGRISANRNFGEFAMYISLFPQLIAGPIVRYSDIAGEIRQRTIGEKDLGEGMERFVLGLAKKILLANGFAELAKSIGEISQAGSLTTSLAWMLALAQMLQIYFDFSGYSDMAIGIGRLFGFHFPENFRYPYEAATITEFWNRWHMTLSSFFKEYLYIPLGGNRKGAGRQILNLFLVWALTGLWHGAAVNFLLWGLYYFVFLVLEKFVLKRFLEKCPPILKHSYAMLVVLFGWVIFFAESAVDFLEHVRVMFVHTEHAGVDGTFFWFEYGVLFLIGLFCATSLPKKGYDRLPWGARLAAGILLLVLCSASLIGGSFNPFLYFRF